MLEARIVLPPVTGKVPGFKDVEHLLALFVTEQICSRTRHDESSFVSAT
jgi:hypothetical protein